MQISHNKSLDGVLDQLNSRNVTEAGPADLLDDAASDEDEGVLPTAGAGEHALHCSLRSALECLYAPTSKDGVYRPLLVQHDLWSNTSMSMPAALPLLCPRQSAWLPHMHQAVSRLLCIEKGKPAELLDGNNGPTGGQGLPSRS